MPLRWSAVQGLPSSQLGGQAPASVAGMAGSHISPGSSTLLPHSAWQSTSSSAVAPLGQQPSAVCPDGDVTGKCRQRAWQVSADVSSAVMQG